MASHGKSRHIKRLAAPRILGIPRKGSTYIHKPSPGKHPFQEGVSLQILLRDLLHHAGSTRDVKRLLQRGEVLLDGRVAKDRHAIAGLMDIVRIPPLSATYRVAFLKGKLKPVPIPESEAGVKLCKVRNKTLLRGGKVQLNLHDGRNYLVEKEEDQFKPGDALKLALPEQKLQGFIRFEKGARCYIYKGRHSGQIGVLEEIIEHKGSKESDARVKLEGGDEVITLKGYLFPVTKEFSV